MQPNHICIDTFYYNSGCNETHPRQLLKYFISIMFVMKRILIHYWNSLFQSCLCFNSVCKVVLIMKYTPITIEIICFCSELRKCYTQTNSRQKTIRCLIKPNLIPPPPLWLKENDIIPIFFSCVYLVWTELIVHLINRNLYLSSGNLPGCSPLYK